MDLMYALDDYTVRTKSSPTIVWIPGHLGNETADDLCKRALRLDAVDIPTTLEYREARTIYRDFFLRKWQAEWPPPTPDPTTEPWSRPSAWLGNSVTRTGGKKSPSTDSDSDTAVSTTSFISGADTLPETATGVASRKPSAISFWSALPRRVSRTTSPGNAHATTGPSTCAPHSVSLAAWTS